MSRSSFLSEDEIGFDQLARPASPNDLTRREVFEVEARWNHLTRLLIDHLTASKSLGARNRLTLSAPFVHEEVLSAISNARQYRPRERVVSYYQRTREWHHEFHCIFYRAATKLWLVSDVFDLTNEYLDYPPLLSHGEDLQGLSILWDRVARCVQLMLEW